MKKVIAIAFVLILFIQVAPVWNLFVDGSNPVSSWIDEDKPDDSKSKENKAAKAIIVHPPVLTQASARCEYFDPQRISSLPAPYLDSFSPPPDRGTSRIA